MLTPAEIVALNHNIENVWSLADYLAHLNARARAEMEANPGMWCSEFTEDLAYWAETGITTARGLADELDACFEKEVRKAMMDDMHDEMDRAHASQEAADLAKASERVAKALEPKTATLGDIWPS